MTEDKTTQEVCVLVLDYGSPRSLNDIEEYYTRIRRGHRPSDEELQGLRHKYERIGGQSQLMESTAWQVKRLQEDVQNQLPLTKVTAVQGHKYIEPLIADVAKELKGYDAVVVLMMNPYGTDILNASYLEPLKLFMSDRWKIVKNWADAPTLVQSWTERVQKTMRTLPVTAKPFYVFTAHSVPLMQGISYDGYHGRSIGVAERYTSLAKCRGSWGMVNTYGGSCHRTSGCRRLYSCGIYSYRLYLYPYGSVL